VAESAFTQAFLRRAIEIETTASTGEIELLDRTLAHILNDPSFPGRFSASYDPQHPTFLFWGGPFLIAFAVDDETDRE
jgi:hypothetical protein